MPGEKTTKERIRRLKTVLEADPASVAFFPLGKVLYSAGFTDEAINIMEKGLQFHPEFLAARLGLARMFREAGRDDSAVEQLERILSFDYYNLEALRAIVGILSDQGYNKEALRHLKRLLELEPDDEDLLDLLENLEREVIAPTASEEEPETSAFSGEFATLTMAEIYMKQGLWKKARDICRQILDKEPSNIKASQKLAEIEQYLSTATEAGKPPVQSATDTAFATGQVEGERSAMGPETEMGMNSILASWESFQRSQTGDTYDIGHLVTDEIATPPQPLITDEELERFAASIDALSMEAREEKAREITSEAESFEVSIPGLPELRTLKDNIASSAPDIPVDSGVSNEVSESELVEITRIEEELAPRMTEETQMRLEEMTSPESFSLPEMRDLTAVEVTLPEPEPLPRLEEMTSPESFSLPEMRDLTAVEEPQPELEPLPRLEEMTSPESFSLPEMRDLTAVEVTLLEPEPLPRLEEMTSPESFSLPEMRDLTAVEVAQPEPEPLPRLEEIVSPESFNIPYLSEISTHVETGNLVPEAEDMPEHDLSTERLIPELQSLPEHDLAPERLIPPDESIITTDTDLIPPVKDDVFPIAGIGTFEIPEINNPLLSAPEPPQINPESTVHDIADLLGSSPLDDFSSGLPVPPPPPPIEEPPRGKKPAPGGEAGEFNDWLDDLNS